MGYVYEKNPETGKYLLCCDMCGHSGGVRKYKCPYNWCQAIALCPACAKEIKPRSRAYKEKHTDCEVYAARSKAQAAHRQALIDSGYYVRWSAIGTEKGVRVTFTNGNESKEYLMTEETYHAIPLLVPATIEDYAKIGAVTLIE